MDAAEPLWLIFYTTMNKKVKIVQWDEQCMKQFKSFLKQMYGEYGKDNISYDRKIKH